MLGAYLCRSIDITAVIELGNLGISVSSRQTWKEFVCSIVGTEWVDGPTPDTAFLRIDDWHHRFDLTEDGRDVMTFAGSRVAGTDEFHEMHKRLEEAGIHARICSEDETKERHVLKLTKQKDSDGNPPEIFHSPHVQADNPFYPSRRMYGKFLTGADGIYQPIKFLFTHCVYELCASI